jgi:hypothetical protein
LGAVNREENGSEEIINLISQHRLEYKDKQKENIRSHKLEKHFKVDEDVGKDRKCTNTRSNSMRRGKDEMYGGVINNRNKRLENVR